MRGRFGRRGIRRPMRRMRPMRPMMPMRRGWMRPGCGCLTLPMLVALILIIAASARMVL